MNQSQRILVATGLFPPEIGGPATYTKKLATFLPTKGFTVTVVPFRLVRFLPPGIRHVVYFFLVLVRGLFTDIIYAQDPVSVGLPAMCAAKILRKKFFLKVVGDYAWEQGTQRWGVTDPLDDFVTKYGQYPFLVRALKRIESFVARAADTIVVPSNYLKKIVLAWNVSPKKIAVIYNSVAVPDLPETKEELRQRLGFKGPVLLTAGRLVPWKGMAAVIEILPELLREFPELTLVVVGSGPDRERLRLNATEMGVADRVFFIGALGQRELFRHIKAADAFVLNTAYEGFSHQLVEVLALGTPIVTTNIGGNPEIIQEGENGVLVDYNDTTALVRAIKKILTDKIFTAKITMRGRVTIDMFTEDRMISGLLSLLKK